MPLAAGTIIDSYEILAPIGAGGMGEVYRARDTSLKRMVGPDSGFPEPKMILPDVRINLVF